MEIEIACSRTIDNNLSVPKVELINVSFGIQLTRLNCLAFKLK